MGSEEALGNWLAEGKFQSSEDHGKHVGHKGGQEKIEGGENGVEHEKEVEKKLACESIEWQERENTS